MRILMLGNSYTYYNDMPEILAEVLAAEVVQQTRGGAHLSEQLDPEDELGAGTLKALSEEHWDYVILQEYSNGPITHKSEFLESVAALCEKARAAGAIPLLYVTWPYMSGSEKLAGMKMSHEEMAAKLEAAYEEAAKQNGVHRADVCKRFLNTTDQSKLYMEDGSHPTPKGSRIAALAIAITILKSQLSELI